MIERLISQYETASPAETITLAQEFAATLKAGDNVLYIGEMGAGKTHFTKGIARRFGYKDEAVSPTFTLVNEYNCTPPIFHFDLFRLSDFDDLYAIGFFDYLDRGGILAVEWSENIASLTDNFESWYEVRIDKPGGDDRRTITITYIAREEK